MEDRKLALAPAQLEAMAPGWVALASPASLELREPDAWREHALQPAAPSLMEHSPGPGGLGSAEIGLAESGPAKPESVEPSRDLDSMVVVRRRERTWLK